MSPVLPELALRVEKRVFVDGFVRWYRAGELLAADAPEEAAPSGLGPDDPPGCEYGCGDGEPGCSGTVCGTSTMSARVGAVADCATGEKACVTGEARVGIACCDGCCGTGSLSSGVALAMPVPGFLIGNSSSSMVFVMGMGPDILRPLILWWPVLGLAVVGEAGPKTFVFFMVASLSTCAKLDLWTAREGLNGGEVVAILVVLDTGINGGPEEPWGITITDRPTLCRLFHAVRMIRGRELDDYSYSASFLHRSTWSAMRASLEGPGSNAMRSSRMQARRWWCEGQRRQPQGAAIESVASSAN